MFSALQAVSISARKLNNIPVTVIQPSKSDLLVILVIGTLSLKGGGSLPVHFLLGRVPLFSVCLSDTVSNIVMTAVVMFYTQLIFLYVILLSYIIGYSAPARGLTISRNSFIAIKYQIWLSKL